MKLAVMTCAIGVLVCLPAVPAFAASCDSLAALALKDTTITMAQLVPAGQFSAPGERQGGGRGGNPYKDLPEFCRVAATLKPTSDSDIKVEVWLPASNWNGKFQAVGNGGWAGVISYSAMAEAVRAGYATASTDTGHVGGRGTFALDHPEKLIDFAWRSEHEMTVKAKAVIQAFYGSAPKLSYWNGCSTGGRQGLKEAQKFPDDYDAIIAGAPANRTAISLWIAAAVLKDPASYIPPSKYPVIHQAALAACDARDGLKDGLIDDPTKCDFDPEGAALQGRGRSRLSDRSAGGRRRRRSIRPPSTRAPESSCLRRWCRERNWAGAFRPWVRSLRPISTISIDTSSSRTPIGTGRRSTSTATWCAATCRRTW